ncbi:hypothetical protein MC7420_2436, partial [Coleofasciculus chthonoplastes PCC 7420]
MGILAKNFAWFNGVKSIAFSPDGKWLACGNDDYTIKVWALETGQELYTLMGHSSSVNQLSLVEMG